MVYLVTGTAGFIGARFAASCAKQGIEVIGVDELPLFAQRPEHESLGLRFVEKIDREKLASHLPRLASQVQAVIHLGACADTTETDVAYLRRVNVEYSQMLWNFCAEKKIPYVYASSAATYGDGSNGYDDDETRLSSLMPLNAYDPSIYSTYGLWPKSVPATNLLVGRDTNSLTCMDLARGIKDPWPAWLSMLMTKFATQAE